MSVATLRQVSAVPPPDRTWGLWASRQIVARIMDTFGPSLAGTHVEQVDTVMADGRRVVGEWVRAADVPTGEYRFDDYRPAHSTSSQAPVSSPA